MSNKTNDEKLRILRERLAQIKEKENNSSVKLNLKNEKLDKENHLNSEYITQDKKPTLSSWIFKFTLIMAIAFGFLYAYNKFNKYSLNTNTELKKVKKSIVNNPINYNLNLKGKNIAITATFDDKESAKAMANNLEIKGFKSNYFYLPDKSNSTKQVYQVFVGPYENEEETNQWVQNIDLDISIVDINSGTISKTIKIIATK